MAILPRVPGLRSLLASLKRTPAEIRVSPLLLEAAEREAEAVLEEMGSAAGGLTEEEASRRLEEHGPNEMVHGKRAGWPVLLRRAFLNPLVLLLGVLATISFLTGDLGAGLMMSVILTLGVVLRFTQEARAGSAAAKLEAMISVTATVVRGGEGREVSLADLVPGDVVKLAAGDMVPADVRLLSSKDLFLIQSSLTGEALPVEKFSARQDAGQRTPLELTNVCFLGTSVESGSATAVVVATGAKTYLGSLASVLAVQPVTTSFDRGMNRFTWVMIQFMLVMVPLVFVVNGLTKHNWGEAFFFSLAVAVGLTPEMLPMIVTVCLSKGAMAMSRKKVIVKRLNSIQNFGAMDILCTDKTGTLTLGHVILKRYFDVVGHEDESVLLLAYLNSYFQTGLKNLLDQAVLEHQGIANGPEISSYRKLDEIPFDFSRKVMSVVLETAGGRPRIVTKGAPQEVFRRCSRFELDGQVYPLHPLLIIDLEEEYQNLSAEGFRVLAVAYSDVDTKGAYSKEDETDLVLKGYVAFLDPAKESAASALAALANRGLSVKVLTGDNELVSRKICQDVGVASETMLLGADIEKMSDAELAEASEGATLFARLSPADKERIIRALQSKKHVVGFLGDGVNDAPALRTADVGISVDTAVDIAKESADIILLEKSLAVLDEGVVEGRKVFGNIIKYIRMGASSNFGNMLSVVGASSFLPFLPMAPIQILTNNLLYDFSQVPIPTDEVDAEQIAKPRPWSMNEIVRFILFVGPLSSIFDYTTYFIMLYVFHCWNPANAPLFHTGWFVESLLTQTLIIHVIRTNHIPFLESRASWPLILTTGAIMTIGMWLPASPFGASLGLTRLPPLYWPLLVLTLVSYAVLTHGVKVLLLRKGYI
jgi:Mg2+-importing ATPase